MIWVLLVYVCSAQFQLISKSIKQVDRYAKFYLESCILAHTSVSLVVARINAVSEDLAEASPWKLHATYCGKRVLLDGALVLSSDASDTCETIADLLNSPTSPISLTEGCPPDAEVLVLPLRSIKCFGNDFTIPISHESSTISRWSLCAALLDFHAHLQHGESYCTLANGHNRIRISEDTDGNWGIESIICSNEVNAEFAAMMLLRFTERASDFSTYFGHPCFALQPFVQTGISISKLCVED